MQVPLHPSERKGTVPVPFSTDHGQALLGAPGAQPAASLHKDFDNGKGNWEDNIKVLGTETDF